MSRAPLHQKRLGAFAPATCIIGYRRGTSLIAVDLCAEKLLYGPAGILSGPMLPVYTKFARRYQGGGTVPGWGCKLFLCRAFKSHRWSTYKIAQHLVWDILPGISVLYILKLLDPPVRAPYT